MIISINAEKLFVKVQHPLTIKALSKNFFLVAFLFQRFSAFFLHIYIYFFPLRNQIVYLKTNNQIKNHVGLSVGILLN